MTTEAMSQRNSPDPLSPRYKVDPLSGHFHHGATRTDGREIVRSASHRHSGTARNFARALTPVLRKAGYTRPVKHFRPTPADLAREVKDSRLSLLVGSGTSTACGLPSWDKVLTAMKNILRRRVSAGQRGDLESFLKTHNHLRIAERYRRAVGEPEYYRFLRNQFRHCSFKIAPILRHLRALTCRVVFTTNYDKVLETAFRGTNGEDPIVIFDHLQLSGLPPDELRIVKLHGDIDHPRSIVLTERDYANYDERYTGLSQYFTGEMAFGSLLLVGFGLRDPNFDRLHANVQKLMMGGSRVIALMAAQNHFDIDDWEASNLEIANFPTHADIVTYLRNVANKI